MTAIALALALLAAVMHATWNLLLKDSGDRVATVGLIAVVGAALYLPWVYLVSGTPTGVWDHVLASSLVHSAYFLSLITAYERADFSVAYPVARGVAPAAIALGGVVLLGDHLNGGELAAVLVIVGALVALAWSPGVGHGLPWALATGAATVVYTLVDAAAVRAAGNALSYTVTVTALASAVLFPAALWRRGPKAVFAVARTRPWTVVTVAVLNIGAYALVLLAASLAPVGLVAAVRESSVVIGAVAGIVLFGEPFGRRRITAAAMVAAGVVLLALL